MTRETSLTRQAARCVHLSCTLQLLRACVLLKFVVSFVDHLFFSSVFPSFFLHSPRRTRHQVPQSRCWIQMQASTTISTTSLFFAGSPKGFAGPRTFRPSFFFPAFLFYLPYHSHFDIFFHTSILRFYVFSVKMLCRHHFYIIIYIKKFRAQLPQLAVLHAMRWGCSTPRWASSFQTELQHCRPGPRLLV